MYCCPRWRRPPPLFSWSSRRARPMRPLPAMPRRNRRRRRAVTGTTARIDRWTANAGTWLRPARATPAPETDHAAADETPASQLTRPARLVTQERIATPTEQAAPPEAEPLQTRLARASSAEQADAAPSVPAPQAAANEAAFNLLEERRAQLPASPPPAVSTSVAQADPSSISLFQILLISFMAACLLASAVLHMLRASRRRREVRTVDLNDQSPLRKRAAIQAAALRAPPADVVEIDDDRLRAFERNWRQRAA